MPKFEEASSRPQPFRCNEHVFTWTEDIPSIIFILFTLKMWLCSYQWPFLWSFYLPLPCPQCALVNVRRTRRMDGCVNTVGDVRDDNYSWSVSRIYETYRFWAMYNLIVEKKKKNTTTSLSHFESLAVMNVGAKPIEQTHIQERKE